MNERRVFDMNTFERIYENVKRVLSRAIELLTEREKLPPLLHSAARICNENFWKKKALCSVMTEQSIWMYI